MVNGLARLAAQAALIALILTACRPSTGRAPNTEEHGDKHEVVCLALDICPPLKSH